MKAMSDLEVWAKYTRVGRPDECWEWFGYTNPKGYGQTFRKGRTVRAHQLAYSIFNNPIPSGHVVRHKCDNRLCCNPGHLETGTSAQNTADRDARGRTATGERASNYRHGRYVGLSRHYRERRVSHDCAR